MKWRLAKVIELLFGGDGVARVAVLKTVRSDKASSKKVCLLPLKVVVTQPQQLIYVLIRSLILIASRKLSLSISHFCIPAFLWPALGWLSRCKISTNSDLDIKCTLVSPDVLSFANILLTSIKEPDIRIFNFAITNNKAY